MFYARSLSRVGAGDLSSEFGSTSSTCLLEGDLGEASKIFSGWIEKSIEGSKAIIEGICGSFGKKI